MRRGGIVTSEAELIRSTRNFRFAKMSAAEDIPEVDASMEPMARPKQHNDLLGDQAALDRAWEEDGYWFFKNVLDTEAVAKLRGVYVEELDKLKVIDKQRVSEDKVFSNGKSLDGFPYRMEPLMEKSPWGKFVEEPGIDSFFRKLLQDDPFWVPIVEYRATPPVSAKPPSRFDGVHQDGRRRPAAQPVDSAFGSQEILWSFPVIDGPSNHGFQERPLSSGWYHQVSDRRSSRVEYQIG